MGSIGQRGVNGGTRLFLHGWGSERPPSGRESAPQPMLLRLRANQGDSECCPPSPPHQENHATKPGVPVGYALIAPEPSHPEGYYHSEA